MAYSISNNVDKQEFDKRFKGQKNGLYIGLASVAMVFAGFTSAFLVRRASGGWTTYLLPDIFWISTIVILTSSASLFFARYFFNKNQFTAYRWSLVSTFLLGVVFLFLQKSGWDTLKTTGVWVDGTPSGSFFYLISWFHAAHIVGGLFVLLFALYRSLTKFFDIPRKFTVVSNGLTLTSIYWHFVDILWVYLFLFIVWYN